MWIPRLTNLIYIPKAHSLFGWSRDFVIICHVMKFFPRGDRVFEVARWRRISLTTSQPKKEDQKINLSVVTQWSVQWLAFGHDSHCAVRHTRISYLYLSSPSSPRRLSSSYKLPGKSSTSPPFEPPSYQYFQTRFLALTGKLRDWKNGQYTVNAPSLSW